VKGQKTREERGKREGQLDSRREARKLRVERRRGGKRRKAREDAAVSRPHWRKPEHTRKTKYCKQRRLQRRKETLATHPSRDRRTGNDYR
jgi:hypothetical protein